MRRLPPGFEILRNSVGYQLAHASGAGMWKSKTLAESEVDQLHVQAWRRWTSQVLKGRDITWERDTDGAAASYEGLYIEALGDLRGDYPKVEWRVYSHGVVYIKRDIEEAMRVFALEICKRDLR